MDARQNLGLVVSKPPTGPTPGKMNAGQYPGLVVCKPPTGPTPDRFRRTKVGKYSHSHIPNKELFNRMVGKKRPTSKKIATSKAVSDPIKKEIHGFVNSLVGLEEPKQQHQEPQQRQQQPKQWQLEPKQQQQGASVRPNWHGINNPARPNVYRGYEGSREVGLPPLEEGQSSMDADVDDLLRFAASFSEGA